MEPEGINIETSRLDRCKGCIFGSLVGDATGAVLEFAHSINTKMVEDAMNMCGGGALEVAPGQITDDGELTLSVLAGLAKCENGYDPNLVCVEYGRWIQSHPFDIGITTRNALMHSSSMKADMSARITQAAILKSDSISNGSTMKLSPTAVWASFLDDDKELVDLVTTETMHMHHHPDVIDCNIALCIAIRELIRGNTPLSAYEKQKEYALRSNIKEWIEQVEQNKMVVCNRNIGWVKIAYQRSMFYLKENTKYEDAIRELIAQGGDTDTNACIAGMVLGARDGFEALPKHMVDAVMKCNTKGKRVRPDFLWPGKVFESNFAKMTQNCAKLFMK